MIQRKTHRVQAQPKISTNEWTETHRSGPAATSEIEKWGRGRNNDNMEQKFSRPRRL